MNNNALYALLISFVAGVVLCPVLIPFLRKLKFGQQVREDGPKTHLAKSGTPTMGGFAIVGALLIGTLPFVYQEPTSLFIIITMLGFGAIGFLDDYIKVVKKRSLGLRAYQKIVLQFLMSGFLMAYLYRIGFSTAVYIPFLDGITWEMGILFYPFLFVFIIGVVNSVNLTDGLDGLVSSVTIVVLLFFGVVAWKMNSPFTPVIGGAIGALLSYLMFNSYPGSIMMGDTGSFAIGGLVAAIAVTLNLQFYILLVGIIYFAEAISVFLQVGYFKATKGKRLFKMAPLHHHFEMMGWKETKVVTVFTVVTAVLSVLSLILLSNIL